jgi:hypothetical protein
MMESKNQEDLLNNVEKNRRDFIRRAIVGTTFAVPWLASFSMDGALIDTAEAGSDSYCTNQPSTSNQPYYGWKDFQAKVEGHVVAIFSLTHNGMALVVQFQNQTRKTKFHNASIQVFDTTIVHLKDDEAVFTEDLLCGTLYDLLYEMNDKNAFFVYTQNGRKISAQILGI